jgi:hypothetical protein
MTGLEPSTFKFGGDPKQMKTFTEIIYDQAEQYHWNNIVHIEDDDETEDQRNVNNSYYLQLARLWRSPPP